MLRLRVTGITLNKGTLEFVVGDKSQQLTATVEPDGTDQSVTWSSSDESVATVVDGLVNPVECMGRAIARIAEEPDGGAHL